MAGPAKDNHQASNNYLKVHIEAVKNTQIPIIEHCHNFLIYYLKNHIPFTDETLQNHKIQILPLQHRCTEYNNKETKEHCFQLFDFVYNHRVPSKRRRNGANAGIVVYERRDMVFLTDSPLYLLEDRFNLQVN